MTQERLMPHNLEAEQALLGSILLSNEVLDEAVEVVSESDFYRPAHQLIFHEMEYLRSSGEAVDHITLSAALDKRGIMERVGGVGYLVDLGSACVSSKNWRSYADIVRKTSVYRSLIGAGSQITAMGYDAGEDIQASLSESLRLVSTIEKNTSKQMPSSTDICDSISNTIISGGIKNYIMPPHMNVRLRPDDLVVIGAAPSVGKTALAMNWADEWSKRHKVAYFEYEMSEDDLMTRLVCKYSGVLFENIQDAIFEGDETERVVDALRELKSRHLSIQEVWCDIEVLCSKIRRVAADGTEIVFIDHLGLIPFKMPKGMNYAKAVGFCVTNRLKRLASELGIIIVLLVQLSRDGQKTDGYPKLYHLRDSGEIEQDAAVVLMAWSDKLVWDDAAKRCARRDESKIVLDQEIMSDDFNVVRIGVEKNRNGALSHKWCIYHGSKFSYEYREPIPLFRNRASERVIEEEICAVVPRQEELLVVAETRCTSSREEGGDEISA